MAIELKTVNEADRELWDNLVHASPQGTIFHTWKWMDIVRKYSKSTFYPIIGYNGTVPIGVYPLFAQKIFGMLCVFSPPPSMGIPYLGPAIADYDKYKQSKRESISKGFQQSIDKFIFSTLKAKYSLLLLGPAVDPRQYIWTGYKLEPYFDFFIDLRPGTESIWKDFDKDARDHIKKVASQNLLEPRSIEITDGSRNDLSGLFEALVRRYQEQHRKVTVPKEYLLDIYDAFYPDNIRMFTVKYKGQNINGILAITFRSTISFWIGAPKPEIKEISSNEINHWEAIKWACEHNFSLYEEFGAGTERLSRSKSKYNPQLRTRFKAEKYSSSIYSWGAKGYDLFLRNGVGSLFTVKK